MNRPEPRPAFGALGLVRRASRLRTLDRCRVSVSLAMGVASFGLITGGVVAMSLGHAQRRRARLELASFGVTLRGGGLQLRVRF